MTISAVRIKTDSRRRGFTLIEIVVVLAIMALVIGGSVAFLSFHSDERALRDASSAIEQLAKRGRATAILQQTPYALVFQPGSVRLVPLARTSAEGSSLTPVAGDAATDPRATVMPDPRISVFIRRWNTDAWLPMDDRTPQVWRFDPDGLCEPVSVRLVADASFIETTFHPLTASVADRSYSFK